jgi:hypothetical protein
LISLSNFIASCWNFCPSAAVQNLIFNLPSPSPTIFKTSFKYSTWRYAK